MVEAKQRLKPEDLGIDLLVYAPIPPSRERLTLGQRAADKITKLGGSWTFIILFFIFLFTWIAINTWLFLTHKFDPYPFILLNLLLSCLAAIQAPIILMSQNREAERDRIDARYDHAVNRKAELEIQDIQQKLELLQRTLEDLKKKR